MTEERLLTVARLDGFLSGIAAMRGEIRQYSAYAYLLENIPIDRHPADAIRERYRRQNHFDFDSSKQLEGGMRELEQLLRTLLPGQLPVASAAPVPAVALGARAGFLSFRVMDAIDSIFKGDIRRNPVYRLASKGSGTESDCTFLCVRNESELLVMQFNDNTSFRPPV